MTDIEITAMEPGHFGVQVIEGDNTTTSHRVQVPQAMVDDLNMADVDQELLVRESFEFLLEREAATSILPEFALDQIAGFFPEYYDEIRARIGG